MHALEGLPKVSKVEMDLRRDLFTVHAGRTRPRDVEMIRAIRALGYRPSIVARAPPPEAPVPVARAGPMPALVAAALVRARAEDKLVLLDFFATWCGPCKRMRAGTWPASSLAPLMARLVFLEIDTDAHPELARHFGVVGLPDVRMLDPSGKELVRLRGYADAKRARAALEPFVQPLMQRAGPPR